MSETKPVAYIVPANEGEDLPHEPLYPSSAITSLMEENAALAAHACIFPDGSGLTGDEHGNSICLMQRRVAELESLVLGYRDNNDELAAAWSAAEARAQAAEQKLENAAKKIAWAVKLLKSYVERDENDGLVLGEDFARHDTAKDFIKEAGE
jgi:hypothetical protein